ncbi:MAG: cytochrome c3 family protein [Thermodesulfovibrionales bacterium]
MLVLILLVLSGYIFLNIEVCQSGIANTKHNLSVTGPGSIKAVTETEICVFCHTPHGATTELPLWNHALTTHSYVAGELPSTSTGWPGLLSTVQPPDKASKLCLSCHDGTVAVGLLVNMPGPGSSSVPISMQGTTGGKMPATAYGYIGTNLSGTHPVSIAVNDTLINDKNACPTSGAYTLQYPPDGDPVQLKPTSNLYKGGLGRSKTTGSSFTYNQGVQCTSCHDPHLDGAVDFLVKGTGSPFPVPGHPGNVSALCTTCHPGTCP